MQKVILLLGSNLENRFFYLESAKKYIKREISDIKFETPILENPSEEFTASLNFYNQMIAVETSISPIKLLKKVKKIENEMGRIYTKPLFQEKYSSRNIDIDVIKYGDIQFISEKLTIPHLQIKTRNFAKFLILLTKV